MKHSLRLHVHLISAVSHARPGRLTSPQAAADIVLHPEPCTDSWFSLTFSKTIPEGLCNSFQVNDLTFQRNASKKESGHFVACVCVLWNFFFFFFYILHCSVVATFIRLLSVNLFGAPSSCLARSVCQEREAHLKRCYLT